MQIKDMLPKGDFEVLEAKDGVEGFEIISQERPNLILIDFFMPRMNGWEVVQKIQTFPKLQSIPIVMMSGRREDVEKAVPELFDYFEFVGKPFEQNLLLKAIHSATTKAKQRYQTLRHTKLSEANSSYAGDVATLNGAAVNSTVTSVASSVENASNGSDEIYQLKAELERLQQENAKIKTEFQRLKKQVAHILAFLKRKVK